MDKLENDLQFGKGKAAWFLSFPSKFQKLIFFTKN
jgi:hypothetical protein